MCVVPKFRYSSKCSAQIDKAHPEVYTLIFSDMCCEGFLASLVCSLVWDRSARSYVRRSVLVPIALFAPLSRRGLGTRIEGQGPAG